MRAARNRYRHFFQRRLRRQLRAAIKSKSLIAFVPHGCSVAKAKTVRSRVKINAHCGEYLQFFPIILLRIFEGYGIDDPKPLIGRQR